MKAVRILILVVAVIALGATLYWWTGAGREVSSPQGGEPPALPSKVTVPKLQHPVAPPAPQVETSEEKEEPLPTLKQSDTPLRDAISALLPGRRLDDLFILRNIIERVVLMIDNLPRKALPINSLPVRQAPGTFRIEEGSGGPFISPDNARRYTPFVRLVNAVDAAGLVAVYVRYYPLFQQAYGELGNADRYFNDRLIEVIDHLIATPEVTPPVALVRPKVRYLYADPELEALSAGRKILIRMGPKNAETLKAKLREIRAEVVGQGGVSEVEADHS